MEFEWDDAKAALNLRTHGVGFELATSVFQDVFAVEWIDKRNDYDEERFVTIGMAAGQILLTLVYAERGENIRIISARKATTNEEIEYYRQNS